MLNVVIADDYAQMRRVLRRVLSTEEDLSVVAEAVNGVDAIRTVAEWRPDLLVLDLKMPGGDGVEVTRTIRNACPNTRIIICSLYSEPQYIRSALEAGASAYVDKGSAPTDLVPAVREVIQGRQYLSERARAALEEQII